MLNHNFENISNEIKAIRLMLSGDSGAPGHANDLIGIDLRIKWITECLEGIEKSASLISKLMIVLIAVQLFSLFIK